MIPAPTTVTTAVQTNAAAANETPLTAQQEDHHSSLPAVWVQRKLSIGAADDPLEKEADAMADKVMRMPMPQPVSFLSSQNMINRKCAHCEEEEKLQRKESNNESVSIAPPIVHDALSAGGKSLDAGTRSFMEPRFNCDFSKVKIHDGDIAAKSASSINALAYTSGNNIVFNSGQYDTASEPGKRLLAHELTHVVQQGTQAGIVQKFGSDEHRKIGDSVVKNKVLVTSYGTMTFGEMIAIAGDYFETIDEIAMLAESYGQYGKDQIDYALWKVNSTRTKPSVSKMVTDAVDERFNRLAAKNETHFSTGSSPGNSNKEKYIEFHTKALNQAFLQGMDPLVIRRWTWEAQEAFSQHFLTDAFSAGHVRTRRGEIKTHWAGLYPSFISNLVTMISCYMASHINARDRIGYAATVNILTGQIEPRIRAMAGPILTSFSLGDLISKVLHDADNAGLDVVSAQDMTGTKKPFKWRAVGDGYLYPSSGLGTMAQINTQDMLQEAIFLSHDEGKQAHSAGIAKDYSLLKQLTNTANFKALPLFPAEDTSSSTNPTYNWKAKDIKSLPANIKGLIVDAFKPGTEIRVALDTLKVDCLTTIDIAGPVEFDLHTKDAFLCFKEKLLGNVWGTIVEIAEGTALCPPGQNDPCPQIRNGCP